MYFTLVFVVASLGYGLLNQVKRTVFLVSIFLGEVESSLTPFQLETRFWGQQTWNLYREVFLGSEGIKRRASENRGAPP